MGKGQVPAASPARQSQKDHGASLRFCGAACGPALPAEVCEAFPVPLAELLEGFTKVFPAIDGTMGR